MLPAVLSATLTGVVAALLACWATGSYLPVVVDDAIPVAPPTWPRPQAVLVSVAGVMLLFGAVALALGRAVRVRD
ncbi:hypothetical protein ACN27F_25780 [Solwaraspora sp. WMMB335]|uniref:hypothetical protein n=1 Tax=Solwaraspora sp. WMMB335 TaxID=3404118 RepID=UPI003B93DF89